MRESLNVELLFQAEPDFYQIRESFLPPPLPPILKLGVKSFVILVQLSDNYIVRQLLQTFHLMAIVLLLGLASSFMLFRNTSPGICEYIKG